MGELLMDVTLLIQSIVGLVTLLGFLVFFLIYKPSKKEKAKTNTTQSVRKEQPSLDALRKIVRHNDATTKELEEALMDVLKYYGTIHPKLGTRSHPDFDKYAEIMFYAGRHKNINKNILIKFDRELEKRNPNYKKDINDALMRGLNSRGV